MKEKIFKFIRNLKLSLMPLVCIAANIYATVLITVFKMYALAIILIVASYIVIDKVANERITQENKIYDLYSEIRELEMKVLKYENNNGN